SAPADRPRTTARAPGPAPTTTSAQRPRSACSAAPGTVPYAPDIDPAAFSATVANPYFPLRPGMRWEDRSATDDGVESTVVEVTTVTRTILGVPCVQVRDTVRVDGDVVEDTLDWYGQDHQGTVWYFGEDTKEYDHGKVTTTEGSWQAGVDGARPGIIMPAAPQAGDRYRQEELHGPAEGVAEGP